MNTGESWPDFDEAWLRVRWMQAKLHLWATRDPGRLFDDLHNLVYDPAFLVHAWERVHGNKGGRSAGVDGVAPRSIPKDSTALLSQLRASLKDGSFRPDRVREADPQTRQSTQETPSGHTDDSGPRGAGLAEVGA